MEQLVFKNRKKKPNLNSSIKDKFLFSQENFRSILIVYCKLQE